jgi:uncharacterized protein (UPF0371 family)
MFEKISGKSPYNSPTDMGVNMAGYCIVDDDACRAAANQEIIRRYYSAMCDRRKGEGSDTAVNKIKLLMEKSGISIGYRPVVAAANIRAEETGNPAAAMELPDGTIMTGKTSTLLGASSALILNVLKYFAGIDDSVKLISPQVIEPIMDLKVRYLGNHNPLLHIDEILIALSIEALTNPAAKDAYAQLPRLAGTEVHSSVILSQVDVGVFKKLGVNLTCEPKYQSKKLFHT